VQAAGKRGGGSGETKTGAGEDEKIGGGVPLGEGKGGRKGLSQWEVRAKVTRHRRENNNFKEFKSTYHQAASNSWS